MKRIKNTFFLLLLFLSLSTSCQVGIDNGNVDTIEENPINDKRVEQFGDSIESALVNADVDKFIERFAKNSFVYNIRKKTDVDDFNASFYKGLISGITGAMKGIPEKIILELENGGYYDLISYRYDKKEETYYALFRLYGESGMNYHDYKLKENDKTGDLQFCDIYIYLSGETFTDTLARLAGFALKSQNKGKNNKIDKNLNLLFEAIEANKVGNFEFALDKMQKVKGEISQDKFFLILKTLVATNLDEKTYLKSMEELIKYHNDDPTIELNKIDYYLLKKEYAKTQESIDVLMDATQDDFLKFSKAGVYYESKDYDKAMENYKYIIDNYNGFFEAQSSYLVMLIILEKYDKAINFLETLTEEYEKAELIEYVEEDDENGENVFKPLMKLELYKDWKKSE